MTWPIHQRPSRLHYLSVYAVEPCCLCRVWVFGCFWLSACDGEREAERKRARGRERFCHYRLSARQCWGCCGNKTLGNSGCVVNEERIRIYPSVYRNQWINKNVYGMYYHVTLWGWTHFRGKQWTFNWTTDSLEPRSTAQFSHNDIFLQSPLSDCKMRTGRFLFTYCRFGVRVKFLYVKTLLVCLYRFKLQMQTRGRMAEFCTGSSLVSAAVLPGQPMHHGLFEN